jgi:alpha-amylase/alpha-mannosidase (GH57 family)
MADSSKLKYVCIHGHFYQPPRENPWLEELETEVSAAPYHDWNDRIYAECYRANAAARLVDDKNFIVRLRNNYKLMSFNFGPTLLRWLQRRHPWLHEVIIEADKESCERLQGHGNAMAQVYNHLIMPLANRRDKISQVLWGIRDFESRFGRKPEGMWLAETAVDRESLQIMADAGIVFTVLSPFQALRWRFIQDGGGWQDGREARIPTGRPYRYDCGNGKSINVFFYDAGLAKGIAFERLLEHSSRLLAQIDAGFEHRAAAKDEPWLIHSATDGESYGHHFRFGDMALAAAYRELERDPASRLLNYGAFLASFPVRAEVEIQENTAWSCAHGVGRWERDCGCHIGGEPGWSQKWRAPLREAMNTLRDSLAVHFDAAMSELCNEPWEVRDRYIDVLTNTESREAFAQKYIRSPSGNGSDIPRFFQLLEMQRAAMAMFTSCGWFFDEISDIGSVIILRFAARAIQLAEQTGANAPELEASFLRILEKAPSNKPEYGNGARVYLEMAEPDMVQKDRVAANYALRSITGSSLDRYRIYCYLVAPEREEDLGSSPVPCMYGRITVTDERTLEKDELLYAVLHFGGLDFRCSVKSFTGDQEYKSILRKLRESVEGQNTAQMIRVLDGVFGSFSFGLRDVFTDQRTGIVLDVAREKLAIYTEFQRHLYQVYRPLIMSMKQWGIGIPSDLRAALRRVLSDEVAQVIEDILAHEPTLEPEEPALDETDFYFRAHTGRLKSILNDAKSWGVALQLSEVSAKLGSVMVATLSAINESASREGIGRLSRLVTICRNLDIKTEVWKMQTLYFDMVQKILNDRRLISSVPNIQAFLDDMDTFLGCHFARFITGKLDD